MHAMVHHPAPHVAPWRPRAVFHARRPLARTARRRKALAVGAIVQETLGYLENRQDMLAYAWCDARGSPIGSGRGESANKLVVERRLQGAGRHWARRQAKPPVPLTSAPVPQPVRRPTAPDQAVRSTPRRRPVPRPAAHQGSSGPYRPSPNHPWRRFRLSWRATQQPQSVACAKR